MRTIIVQEISLGSEYARAHARARANTKLSYRTGSNNDKQTIK